MFLGVEGLQFIDYYKLVWGYVVIYGILLDAHRAVGDACGQALGWNPTPVTLSTDKELLPSCHTSILADFLSLAVLVG
jgi:hypothetical protein